MSSQVGLQAENIVPPRRGYCAAVTVDSTARSYLLTSIAFGKAYNESNASDAIYLTLQNVGSVGIYFHFHDSTDADLNDATVVAAGGTLAFSAAAGMFIGPNSMVDVRIVRATDKYLVLKTSSSSATLRLYASSQPSP